MIFKLSYACIHCSLYVEHITIRARVANNGFSFTYALLILTFMQQWFLRFTEFNDFTEFPSIYEKLH